MAKVKQIKAILKLAIEAGKATPAPPIGPALGQHGVNIQEFVTQYNDKTRDKMGDVIPCILTVFDDRSFTIELKTPPVTSLLLKATGIKKGSAKPNLVKIGKVKRAQIKEIAEKKMADINAISLESAMKIVEGSAKSLGLEIID
ncbi:MAG TPA: 50S ribosomal protein L11 [Candidatus Dojkabacteria bacterium]|jgi:large subunit ribosomal protein L11|nr:50S ribosomal protein L11 [Candidatus Dojkabacteria bacterium]